MSVSHRWSIYAHNHRCKFKCIMALQGYCDESHDGKQERLYAFAGFVASSEVWEAFALKWDELLKKYGLRMFHMVDCEHGRGEFRERPQQQRKAMQRAFISLITESDIYGTGCSIDLKAYEKLRPRFKVARKIPKGRPISGHLDDPYFLSFQNMVENVVECANHAGMPKEEYIAITFDSQQLGERAKVIYDDLLTSDNLEYNQQIFPSVVFSRSIELPHLQAADVLAYELYRHMDLKLQGLANPRWQWKALQKNLDAGWTLLNEEGLNVVLEGLERDRGITHAQ